MSFCAKCGNEVDASSSFCASCGAPMMPPQPQVPPDVVSVTPPPVATPFPPFAYGPPMAPPYSAPGKGSGGKIALFSLLGLVVIGIVVFLFLGFAVGPKWFAKDDSTGGDTTTTTDGTSAKKAPEKAVDTFFESMQNKDGKLLMSVIAPSDIKSALGLDASDVIAPDVYAEFADGLEQGLTESMSADGIKSVSFSGIKYNTKITGDTATVEVVEGTMTTVDTSGNKSSKNVNDSTTPKVLKLVREDGKWYVLIDSIGSM